MQWPLALLLFLFAVGAEDKQPIIEWVKGDDGTSAMSFDKTKSIQIARRIDIEDDVQIAHEIFFGESWNRILLDRQDELRKFFDILEKGMKWASIAQEKDVQFSKELGLLNTAGLGSTKSTAIVFVTQGKTQISFEFNFSQKMVLTLEEFKEFHARVSSAVKYVDKLQAKISKLKDEKEKLESRFEN